MSCESIFVHKFIAKMTNEYKISQLATLGGGREKKNQRLAFPVMSPRFDTVTHGNPEEAVLRI